MIDLELIAKKVDDIEEGNKPALETYALLNTLKKEIESIINQVKPYALEEAKQEPEKTFERDGYKFSFTNGRANYKFDHDNYYNEYKAQLKEREALMKQAAKAWEMNNQIVDENGEVVPPATVSYSQDVLSVKPIK